MKKQLFVTHFSVFIIITFGLVGCVKVNDKAPEGGASLILSSLHGLDFGGVVIGNAKPYEIEIRNIGQLTASTVALQSIVAPFNVTQSSCGTEISGGDSCTVTIEFRPTALGPASLNVIIDFNDGFLQQTITANLSGRGISAPVADDSTISETDPDPSPISSPEASPSSSPEASPSSSPEASPSASPSPSPSSIAEGDVAKLAISDGPLYNFGSVFSGQSPTKSFTVTNNGLTKATGLSFSTISAPFSITSTNCGTDLPSTESCTFTVSYSASGTSTSVVNAVLNYFNGLAASTASISLQGSGRYHTVFVTKLSYNGKLGGLTGGDTKCASAATAAGLSGNWNALLSSSSVNAKDRVSVVTSVYNTKGQALASGATALWGGSLLKKVKYDPYGDSAGNVDVWSGTNSSGTKHADTCNNWTSSTSGNSFEGRAGEADEDDSSWISNSTEHCHHTNRLYCISQ